METFKPIFSIRNRAVFLVTVCLIGSLTAGEPATHSGGSLEEARELLRKGDQAYQAERYAEAVEAYAGARDMIPDSADSAELRAATTTRYAQASVEQARRLSRKGDVAGAKATVDKVLNPSVAPNDPAALALRAQLDDPIRTNPSLTAEYAKDVDAVRRLLYTAEGAYNLGKFDEAKKHYEEVLRIDATNTAARRGMERVAAAKSSYQNAAYDHTRAEMLSQVDAGWELQVPAPELGVGPGEPGGAPNALGRITVAAKLERIIIPKISLDQASLEDALDFLRVRAAESDTLETDPARKGVNFTVNLGPPESEAAKRIRDLRFNLRLTQVPLSGVLKYLTDITHTAFTTDEFSVIITAAGSTSDELIARSYRVPPDFISGLNSSSGSGTGEATEDPFAAAPAQGGLITTRLSAQEAFVKQGVSFPAGASANYSAATNTLRVINTAANQDVISQIVEAMTQTEPVDVVVQVTMIKTEQTNLKELGFDWLVSPVAINADNSVFASGGTVGNSGGRTGADFVSPVNGTTVSGVPTDPTATANPGVATNGLRSGDQAINSDGIDNMINNPNRGTQQKSVAPGIMQVTGLFADNQVQMIMRGLDQKKSVDIMARPSVVTRSGQAAKVELIREFIYPTEYEPPQIPQTSAGESVPVTPATPTAFETRNVGVTLEVLPVAGANKRFVEITLNPSFSDFDGFVNYGSPINTTRATTLGRQTVELTANQILMPVFNTQKLATQLTVADGGTIVMGGLMRESVQNVEDRVPIFGSIPVVGRLFQSTARQPTTTAIIFLVHVELVDPAGRRYRDR